MTPSCPACGKDVLEIDVRCESCGAAIGASGAHKMLGQVMLGQYELVDVLGQGGMSVVFKGKHKLTDQEVALKILPPELAAHSQVKSRFLDEAKALAALDHANIVHLYNFGQENGFFVLAMQFVQGRTWERMILENTRLDWTASCKICVDVLRALEYAHGRGVVHRDMKPSNVLVRGHDGSATVMDFGIAKMTTSTRLTATGQTMGTVRYMSPEQVRGQEVDLKTDIYSLGATLYESLTGDTPFDGETHFEIMTKHLSEVPKRPSSLGIELPASVEDALMRSLAKRADDRFETAREMRKILESALRAADIGLIETQKLGRDVLGALPPKKPKAPTPAPLPERFATANELADQLEPGGVVRRKKRVLPWVLAGVVIAGSGAFVAARLLGGQSDPPARPSEPFPGLALSPGQTIGTLTVTTDGTITAEQVATAYKTELHRLQGQVNDALVKAKKAPVELPDKIREVFALPQSALCMKTAYVDGTPPPECGTVPFVIAFGDQTERGQHDREPRLYLVAEKLTEGIQRGVAQAVCDFQPDSSELSAEICNLAAARATPPTGHSKK